MNRYCLPLQYSNTTSYKQEDITNLFSKSKVGYVPLFFWQIYDDILLVFNEMFA